MTPTLVSVVAMTLRMAEAEEIAAIERERARQRMEADRPLEPSGNISVGSKGETRDKVTEAIGSGSGRAYDKAVKVMTLPLPQPHLFAAKIDDCAGNYNDSAILRHAKQGSSALRGGDGPASGLLQALYMPCVSP